MAGTGFWWIFLSIVLYGLLHSLLAANGVKAFARRIAGDRAYTRFYRLFYVLVGSVTFLPTLALVALLPDRTIYSIPPPWSYLTTLIQGAALVGLGLGVLETGALSFLGIRQLLSRPEQPASQPKEKLVVTGLYRWVRHPLYTCGLLILWLVSTLTWNLLALNLGVSAYLWVGSIFEERKLVEQFGAAYEDYRRRTPRLIPGVKL